LNKSGIIVAILAFSLMLASCTGMLKDINEAQVEENLEVVNEPLEEDVATITHDNKEESAHSFVRHFHNFYNNTVCYDKINSLDMVEQMEALDEILATLKVIKTKNADLKADFDRIGELAREAKENKDDPDLMNYKLLHRYFHDLDIYFNGYDYSQTWGVTTYKR